MKRLISLFLSVAMVMSLSIVAFANTNNEGTYHVDGSYQFSEQELQNLNQFISGQKNQRVSISHATFLRNVAPSHYNQLSDSTKILLGEIPWQSAYSPEQELNVSVLASRYWDASLVKSGSSLKGDAWITRSSEEFVIAQCYVHVPGNYENHVGYAYKITENPSYNTVTRATVYTDPASGTYMTTGVFTWPVYDSNGNLTYSGNNAHSSHLSYVNPYN